MTQVKDELIKYCHLLYMVFWLLVEDLSYLGLSFINNITIIPETALGVGD